MHAEAFLNPAVTVALALAAGMLATALARHLRMPSIVLLLAAGVLLGPDLLNWVRPDSMGGTVHTVVGFAVAIILFEGGMNLNLGRLRQQALAIRRLVTLGAVVSAIGAFLGVYWFLDWDWRLATLFGTLVIVTGPTVIQPLLRRLRLKESVSTVLAGEAVFIDPIGAILAVVALEVILQPSPSSLGTGVVNLAMRLGGGVLMGTVAGLAIALLLRIQSLIPEGLENALVLSLVLLGFQLSEAIQPESGIMTVVMAGLVVGNVQAPALRDLREFKEQLTILMIGLLFILLAADVRLAEVRALGLGAILVVAWLMLVVRPLNVVAGTFGSKLRPREKALLAWMAPRGVVAAAVASIFVQSLESAGIPGGGELRALVFLVIAATVVIQGLSAGWLAKLLGLHRRTDSGWVILSADSLARQIASLLQEHEQEVVLIDSNAGACRTARDQGIPALHGSGLSDRILTQADTDGRFGCIGLTANEEANLLFVTKALRDYRVGQAWVALRRGYDAVSQEQLDDLGAQILFGAPCHLLHWRRLIETERVRWTRFQYDASTMEDLERDAASNGQPPLQIDDLLPVAVERGKQFLLIGDRYTPKDGDILHALVTEERDTPDVPVAGWREVSPGHEGDTSPGLVERRKGMLDDRPSKHATRRRRSPRRRWLLTTVCAAALAIALPPSVSAWYTDGHRRIAATAVEHLPTSVPTWFRDSAEAVGHQAVDPDLWKHDATPALRSSEYPEHFLDLELLEGRVLPHHRYQLLATLARLELDPARVGMLPYAIVESLERLTLAFAEARRWPRDPQIQAKAAVWAGQMAHYASDLEQPLHTTVHFDGRVGADGVSPRTGLHGLVDGLIQALPVDGDAALAGWEPAALEGDSMQAVLSRFHQSHQLVDRVYALEPALRRLDETGEASPELAEFARDRFRASVDLVAALVMRAWNDSAPIVEERELPAWLNRDTPWPLDAADVDPRGAALARRTMRAMGGREAFERTRLLHFVFQVERRGETLARYEHWWDRFDGRYRLEGLDSEGRPFLVLFDLDSRRGRVWVQGEELAPAVAAPHLERAHGRFINDTYWLLMPWKWLDPGVHLRWIGARQRAGREWRVAELTFETGVGLTSGDRYQAWVADDTGRMERWGYVLQTEGGEPGNEAPTEWEWLDWEPTEAGIELARTRRRLPDGELLIRFPIAEARSTVSDDELASLFAAPDRSGSTPRSSTAAERP